jgi:tetratricopeptide (TPR) repeat protein
MKRLLTTLVILTGLIGSAGNVWADAQSDFNKAWEAYLDGDFTEAVKWYRKSAQQGDAEAQSGLGWSYSNGLGVTQDYAEALKWFRKSAEQGYANAQFSLGWHYENGWGVSQDYAEAAKWFRKAAEQGDDGAQRALSNLGDLKIKFAQKWIDQCLFDEIEKITGPETKSIVEKHCSQKIENKSLDWLARNVD